MIRYVLLAAFIICAVPSVKAQDGISIPTAMPTIASPSNSPVQHSSLDLSSENRLSSARAYKALNTSVAAGLAKLRGAKEAKLYKQLSPSVVLVLTNEGLGSGTIIDASGSILTNWHVIAGYEEVGIVFKPEIEGQPVNPEDVRVATVEKVSEQADLALLQLRDKQSLPPPMLLGQDTDIEIGSDVNAIGHPTGEAWTFTKGIVSQMRKQFEWSTKDNADVSHRADVIQTQTPINPGNSGGPLFSDKGKLVGVNAFIAEGEGLNFAVSVGEVRRFLASKATPATRTTRQPGSCNREAPVNEGRDPSNTANIADYDFDCDGYGETRLQIPDAPQDPVLILRDRNLDQKPDMVIVDLHQDEKWDYSLYDDDFDGKWELKGLHPDGGIRPSEYQPYKST